MTSERTGPIAHGNLDLKVKPEWIDFNGHMNIAFYVTAFDSGDRQPVRTRDTADLG